jgi:ribosomal protein S18 acetylase RimI-like enzyme
VVPATIRPYDPGDFEALWRMDAACYAPEIAYSRRTMRAFMRLPGAECLVAEDGGVILGFILTDRDGAAGHVITLDVSPEARRRKIGTALVEAAHASLAARGVREVELETSTANQAGIGFWRRHGYQTQGVLQDFYENGEDAYWMTKSLAKSAKA